MKRLVLYTKQYPFGHQETYVHNEIPYLLNAFDEIVIVPYDAFQTAGQESRLLAEWDAVRLVAVNDLTRAMGKRDKIKRELRAWWWWMGEIVRGRDKRRHLRAWKMCLTRLRLCETQAAVLSDLMQAEGWNAHNTVFYNYWLHFGVIISRHLRRRHPFRVVARAHSLDMYHKDWVFGHLFLPYETLKLRTADAVYSASGHGLKHFQRTFPRMKDKFAFRALGVWNRGTGGTARNAVFTLVSATGIGSIKRLDRIPEILSMLEGPVRWIHFGGGREEGIRELQAAIDEYGVADRVELRGPTPNEEVLRFYREETPDLYLNVSLAETIPVAVMEPMSFGIPVVATAVYGTPEILTEGNGLLIPVDFDSRELADAINGLRRDPDRLRQMGHHARQTFLERFDADKNLKQFSQELSGLITP